MIAVIADDFTGAAEIGGIGLRHRMKVIIETEAIKHADVDLLVVATDTRSKTADDAAAIVAKITEELMALKPRFIYKKLDSALRGNIYQELSSQMDASNSTRALVVAGNPVFGRIIKDGIYFINEVPLDKTGFSHDPDFPILSSSVSTIIGTGEKEVTVGLTAYSHLPESGILMGDVNSVEDLGCWAERITADTLPAGGSGFFDAICLKNCTNNRVGNAQTVPFGNKVLFVMGSSYPKDAMFMSDLEDRGIYISNMPQSLYFGDSNNEFALAHWADDIVSGLMTHGKVAILVTHTTIDIERTAPRVKHNVGLVTQMVIAATQVDELLVEGGSTVSAVLSCLGIKKLLPLHEYATGIIRMKVDGFPDLCLTTKPGSYSWPSDIWGVKNSLIVK
jgi:uncharacterized protein YgbK (DUF1537 family)